VTAIETFGFWLRRVIAPLIAWVEMRPRSWFGLTPILRATDWIEDSAVTSVRTVLGLVAWLCNGTPPLESGCPRYTTAFAEYTCEPPSVIR